MGNAVPKAIKARAKILLTEFSAEFSPDFEKNKKFIGTLNLPFTKPVRNKIAGFIARQAKKAAAQ